MFGRLVRKWCGPIAPEILEVRVHGVQNTPPAEMLETTPDEIEATLRSVMTAHLTRMRALIAASTPGLLARSRASRPSTPAGR